MFRNLVGRAVFRPVSKARKTGTDRLSPQAVALIVKRYAGRIGLDTELISGHSLRAGFVTSAAKASASAWKIRMQ
jgi:hypothetical protein